VPGIAMLAGIPAETAGAMPAAGPGSVPALCVAVVERSRRLRDHAEQQSRRVAHYLPGVHLLDSLGAEFLQAKNFGGQVVGVNIDVDSGLPIGKPLDQQPELLAVQHGPVVLGVPIELRESLSGRCTPEPQLAVMISRRDVNHDFGQSAAVGHSARVRGQATAWR
jgi:hypothetical protein